MNYIYNIFLELYKNSVIKVDVYIIICRLAFIICYRLGSIVGTTIQTIYKLFFAF